ncbi:MAG: transposase family protein [Mycobacteriales bacterium]
MFHLPGIHVIDVGWRGGRLCLTVETAATVVGCRRCGVVADSHGRRDRLLHDIPAFGAPVALIWRVRRFRCVEPACPGRVFTEEHELASPRGRCSAPVGRRSRRTGRDHRRAAAWSGHPPQPNVHGDGRRKRRPR